MSDPDDPFLKLVLEAVLACDGDILKIERYVADKKNAKDPAERDEIDRAVRRVLSFHVPGFQEDTN